MAQRSGLTRGDRRRNNRIETLRAVVRPDRAILSIDLGEDKQVAALMDHDGRVLGEARGHSEGACPGRVAGVVGGAGGQASVLPGCWWGANRPGTGGDR